MSKMRFRANEQALVASVTCSPTYFYTVRVAARVVISPNAAVLVAADRAAPARHNNWNFGPDHMYWGIS